MKTISAMIGMMTALSGCVAKPEPVNPVPFSDKNSYALNIANQTILTRDKSPLRDFSKEEESEIKYAIGRSRNGGDTSLLFGGLKLLTLDLTGLIDVAGGAVSNLADTDHAAGSAHWIIEVDSSLFANELEAQSYILERIDFASKKALSQYGETKKKNVRDGYSVYFVNTNGEEYNMGGFHLDKPKSGLLTLRNGSIDQQREGQYYTYGVSQNDYYLKNMLAKTTTPLMYSVEMKRDIDLREYYKSLTSYLPEGFYLYLPSLPKAKFGGTTYTDYALVLPAIYTQGKKYEFIKPE
ncbi:hypothetical protein [Vibrio furnissii]|jgi:hypothetical protein|uniref:hypothetical protein n=1 Tax=Vibrio furnissii TaxID=29494 RepID=UPI00257381F0|nr:hypothetical protein [Vibrio furnissii]WJG24711.1 hypothetical protein QSU95_23405 [Vibrio furnissii]